MPFTQQELEDAYKQMQQERQDEGNLAALAAKKLDALLSQPNTTFGWLKQRHAGNILWPIEIIYARIKTAWPGPRHWMKSTLSKKSSR